MLVAVSLTILPNLLVDFNCFISGFSTGTKLVAGTGIKVASVLDNSTAEAERHRAVVARKDEILL